MKKKVTDGEKENAKQKQMERIRQEKTGGKERGMEGEIQK